MPCRFLIGDTCASPKSDKSNFLLSFFLVAALFAPQWKTFWIFQSANQFMDLTVAMLLCLAVGLAWRILTGLGRSHSYDIRKVFFGQWNQILAFLLFALIVAASYFYTDAHDYGASKLTRFLTIGMILLIAPFFLILTEEDLRKFSLLFVWFSGATAVKLIGDLEFRKQQAADDITKIGAGWLMGMAVILILFYPLARSRRGQLALYSLMLPLCIAGLVGSAARGPIVSVSIAVLIGLATWIGQGRLRSRTALVLVLLLIAAGIGGAYFALRNTDAEKYNAKANEFQTLLDRRNIFR